MVLRPIVMAPRPVSGQTVTAPRSTRRVSSTPSNNAVNSGLSTTTATSTNAPRESGTSQSPDRFVLTVYVGQYSTLYEALSIEVSKLTTAEEIVDCIGEKLALRDVTFYELAEVIGDEDSKDCKERRIRSNEHPVGLQLLWPKTDSITSPSNNSGVTAAEPVEYRFCLRRKRAQGTNFSFAWTDANDSQLTFEEFIQTYRILLPKGLLSSQADIREFLITMNLNRDNYRMGRTKVFMRESEKLILDEYLHQAIFRRIVTLQRWVRTWLAHKHFRRIKQAVVLIQSHVRRWIAQRHFTRLRAISMEKNKAATVIQSQWKASKERQSYLTFRQATIRFQAHFRGYLIRREVKRRLEDERRRRRIKAFREEKKRDQAEMLRRQSQSQIQPQIVRAVQIPKTAELAPIRSCLSSSAGTTADKSAAKLANAEEPKGEKMIVRARSLQADVQPPAKLLVHSSRSQPQVPSASKPAANQTNAPSSVSCSSINTSKLSSLSRIDPQPAIRVSDHSNRDPPRQEFAPPVSAAVHPVVSRRKSSYVNDQNAAHQSRGRSGSSYTSTACDESVHNVSSPVSSPRTSYQSLTADSERRRSSIRSNVSSTVSVTSSRSVKPSYSNNLTSTQYSGAQIQAVPPMTHETRTLPSSTSTMPTNRVISATTCVPATTQPMHGRSFSSSSNNVICGVSVQTRPLPVCQTEPIQPQYLTGPVTITALPMNNSSLPIQSVSSYESQYQSLAPENSAVYVASSSVCSTSESERIELPVSRLTTAIVDDEKPRLDRRRNRPLKLSLNRSKSKSESELSLEPLSLIADSRRSSQPESLQHGKVAKTTSDSLTARVKPVVREVPSTAPALQDHTQPYHCLPPSSPSSVTSPSAVTSSSLSVGSRVNASGSMEKMTDDQPHSFGAFQKAKKSLKTFIGGIGEKKHAIRENAYMGVGQPTADEWHAPMEENLTDDQRRDRDSSSIGSSGPLSAPLSGPFVSSNFTLLIRHSLKSAPAFHRGEVCAVCDSSMASATALLNSGLKCTECKLFFHNKCIHGSGRVSCRDPNALVSSPASAAANSSVDAKPQRPSRNKNKKSGMIDPKNRLAVGGKENERPLYRRSASAGPSIHYNANSSWSVTRTTEFTDPRDILITDLSELQNMELFIFRKICDMEEKKRQSSKESTVDIVFKLALREFKSNLISTYSVAIQEGHIHVTYKQLIEHFEQVILNVCQKENTWKSFPVTMGVNAFRGYLDEFRRLYSNQKHTEEKLGGLGASNGSSSYAAIGNGQGGKGPKKRRDKSRSRWKQSEEIHEKFGHEFVASVTNIPTVCEICKNLMGLMEKVWICKGCKLTCHKKCGSTKCVVSCRDNTLLQLGKKIFGVPLSQLTSEECRIPPVVDQLISAIELKGLYTEGLYRKSGTTSKINELKVKLEENRNSVDLDEYGIHVLTAVLKCFFRDSPEPLMTTELYDDFLASTSISDSNAQIEAIYTNIGKLPRPNYDLLERLIFHLARVAQQEHANRMTASSLAIVFAPCILRTNKEMQAQDKLSDISKQTACIEVIITERLKEIRDTLADIDILDTACHTASSRLSSLRLSKLHLNQPDPTNPTRKITPGAEEHEEEEAMLTQHIEDIKTEKENLTKMLPQFPLESAGSDEDLLSSATDLDSTAGGSVDEVSMLPLPTADSDTKTSPSNHASAPVSVKPSKMRESQLGPIAEGAVRRTVTELELRAMSKERSSAPNRRPRTRYTGANRSRSKSAEKDNASQASNLNSTERVSTPQRTGTRRLKRSGPVGGATGGGGGGNSGGELAERMRAILRRHAYIEPEVRDVARRSAYDSESLEKGPRLANPIVDVTDGRATYV